MTTEEFIEKAKKIHGNFYNYEKTNLKQRDEKNRVIVTCPIHGDFFVNISSHLRGTKCKKCAKLISSNKKKKNTEYFIDKAKKIHGDKYGYSKVEYANMRTKVCIICPEHGEFWQQPLNHLNGSGCPICGNKKISEKLTKNTEYFIDKAKKNHGDKYGYSKVEYINTRTKVCIICPEHGEFWQKPCDHLCGRGCPKCNESHLEREIESVLKKQNIKYIHNCDKNTFKWLNRQHLDFYLPDYNVAIECQGEQHYIKRNNFLYGNQEKIVERDIIKYNKCLNNNLSVIYFANVDKIDNIKIYTKCNFFNNVEKIINFLKNK